MALTTVLRLKAFLGIKADDLTQDSKLEFFIDAAASTVEGLTGRSFARATYVETISGKGSARILPMHYPIIKIEGVSIASDHGYTNPIALLDWGSYGISENSTEIVSYSGAFPIGRDNVQYTYTAGYDRIPADIELAVCWCAQWYYQLAANRDIGRTSRSKGDESQTIANSIPIMVREICQKYKRYEIPDVSQSYRLA